MENAAKALIIAGAILISITLITIGIFIVSSSESVKDEAAAKLSQQEITAFNSEFVSYVGQQKGSTVKSLIQTVMGSNSSHPDLLVSIDYNSDTYGNNTGEKSLSDLLSEIKATVTYTIKVELSNANRVQKIIIE